MRNHTLGASTLVRLATAAVFLTCFHVLLPATAGAQCGGLCLYEVGTPDSGRSAAGAGARAQDASTAYWNPAGMTELEGTHVQVGSVFGFVDESNYTYMLMNATPSYTQLFTVVNGSRVLVADATQAGIPDTAYHSVELLRSVTTVTVKLDGTQILQATGAGIDAVGLVGVGSFNDSAYFDDIDVTVGGVPTVPAAPSALAVTR